MNYIPKPTVPADRLAKMEGELNEALLLLGIAGANAGQALARAHGAFLASGVPLDYIEPRNAEGGKADRRC